MVKMLRIRDVVEVTGLSSATIWRRERDGGFPSRRRLSGNVVAWRSDEVEAWLKSRPAVAAGDSGTSA